MLSLDSQIAILRRSSLSTLYCSAYLVNSASISGPVISLVGVRGVGLTVGDAFGLLVEVSEGVWDDCGVVGGATGVGVGTDAFWVGLLVGFGVEVFDAGDAVGEAIGEVVSMGIGRVVAARTSGVLVGLFCVSGVGEGSSITIGEMSSGCVYGVNIVFALKSRMLTAAAKKPSTMVISLPHVLINPIQTATVFL
jgi:hypothetical protein